MCALPLGYELILKQRNVTRNENFPVEISKPNFQNIDLCFKVVNLEKQF